MRIHAAAAAAAVLAGSYAGLDRGEWLWVLAAIAFVICAELINSALERIADLAADGRRHPLVKAAKDMGAAAVLTAALFALAVGAIVLLPALIGKWS